MTPREGSRVIRLRDESRIHEIHGTELHVELTRKYGFFMIIPIRSLSPKNKNCITYVEGMRLLN